MSIFVNSFLDTGSQKLVYLLFDSLNSEKPRASRSLVVLIMAVLSFKVKNVPRSDVYYS